MEGSRSTLSPKVYGKGGPLAIAEATADLRNSMVPGTEVRLLGVAVVGTFGAWEAGSSWSSRGASGLKGGRLSQTKRTGNLGYRAACLAR
jgi:hypothetical protein